MKQFISDDVIIGKRMREIREGRRIRQYELAEALKVSPQQIQKYEEGRARLSASALYHAAAFMFVPVSDFYTGLPDPCEQGGHLVHYMGMLSRKKPLLYLHDA